MLRIILQLVASTETKTIIKILFKERLKFQKISIIDVKKKYKSNFAKFYVMGKI